jgi:hypothetical protein
MIPMEVESAVGKTTGRTITHYRPACSCGWFGFDCQTVEEARIVSTEHTLVAAYGPNTPMVDGERLTEWEIDLVRLFRKKMSHD